MEGAGPINPTCVQLLHQIMSPQLPAASSSIPYEYYLGPIRRPDRPITDLPSLPRYLHLKFGPNQVNVTVNESHNALPICNSEYAIAVVLAHTSVHLNDFGYLGVVLVLLPLY
jgi:hypothetical protein